MSKDFKWVSFQKKNWTCVRRLLGQLNYYFRLSWGHSWHSLITISFFSGTFSAYLTLQALYCIVIIAGIAINCHLDVSPCLMRVGLAHIKRVCPQKRYKGKRNQSYMLQTFPCGLETLPTAIYARPLWKTIKAPAKHRQWATQGLSAAAARPLSPRLSMNLLVPQKPLFFLLTGPV